MAETLNLGVPSGVDVLADAQLLNRYRESGMTPEQGQMFAMAFVDSASRAAVYVLAASLQQTTPEGRGRAM